MLNNTKWQESLAAQLAAVDSVVEPVEPPVRTPEEASLWEAFQMLQGLRIGC